MKNLNKVILNTINGFEDIVGQTAELFFDVNNGNRKISVKVECVRPSSVLLKRLDTNKTVWFPRRTLGCRKHPAICNNEISVHWWANFSDRTDIQNFFWN